MSALARMSAAQGPDERGHPTRVTSLTVVVPACNEQDSLPGTLTHLDGAVVALAAIRPDVVVRRLVGVGGAVGPGEGPPPSRPGCPSAGASPGPGRAAERPGLRASGTGAAAGRTGDDGRSPGQAGAGARRRGQCRGAGDPGLGRTLRPGVRGAGPVRYPGGGPGRGGVSEAVADAAGLDACVEAHLAVLRAASGGSDPTG